MKNPLTPAGIEPATFRIVAHHLNHCATAVPRSQRLMLQNPWFLKSQVRIPLMVWIFFSCLLVFVVKVAACATRWSLIYMNPTESVCAYFIYLQNTRYRAQCQFPKPTQNASCSTRSASPPFSSSPNPLAATNSKVVTAAILNTAWQPKYLLYILIL